MKIKLSNLSRTPPCPGINELVSLIPISLLTADIVTSPKNPAIASTQPAKAASKCEKGVRNGAIKTVKTVVPITPPINHSQVLFVLTFGIILCLPNALPQAICVKSFATVISNIKNNKPILPPTGLYLNGITNIKAR